MTQQQPGRLIEVDLPIRPISENARREKSIREGNLSTMHIWWARRPLAACRAVALAALLPDPADPRCEESFVVAVHDILSRLRERMGGTPVERDPSALREALLRLVARVSNPSAIKEPALMAAIRELIGAAHGDSRPLVVDPFGGGGAIPLEALRVGADAWAGDTNPVATLLLRVALEDIPRFGDRLVEAVNSWGREVRIQVFERVGHFYPEDHDGSVPIAYLWARTVTCEGPGCGAQFPLLRQLRLARARGRGVALRMKLDPREKTVAFEVDSNTDRGAEGTVRRGAAICPLCHSVTPVERVRAQSVAVGGLPHQLVAVVTTRPGQKGRRYRAATPEDVRVALEAEQELRRVEAEHGGPLPIVPDEPLPPEGTLGFRVQKYGLRTWGDLFLPRQALTLATLVEATHRAHDGVLTETGDPAFARAVATSLAICVDRAAENMTALCRWNPTGEKVQGTFGRQAIPMVWDCAEVNPFGGSVGDWDSLLANWTVAYQAVSSVPRPGQASQSDARALPLPDRSVAFVFTDPPYYDAVPYADLSGFFYVWLRRSVGHLHPDLFGEASVSKSGEIIVDPSAKFEDAVKDKSFFESQMGRALAEARRVLAPDGIAVIVFAHKTTSGWEAMLSALLDARWVVTGSWPLDTEMQTRLRARDSAALASSVHIVCRPRADEAGVGEWRQVRSELEARVSEWLPRLSREGVEGADAIFACLGPAMEVFSRFERVETAAGDPVPLSTSDDDLDAPAFLPAVWAAVAKEALRMIFEGPEAEGFEEDARLTALWLWTARAALDGNGKAGTADESEDADEGLGPSTQKPAGLGLDYDTARKLAQALGVHLGVLEHPGGIVEVKKGAARLLPVGERRNALLGESSKPGSKGGTLFDAGSGAAPGSISAGETTLDRLHQAMLMFSDSRGEALRRLLAEPGYVEDPRFRRLAQAMSSLYPPSSHEKRWVDGVLGVIRQTGV